MRKLIEKNPRWLTVKHAATYLDCSSNFLDKDRVTGLHGIPYSRLGRHIRYDRFELDKYMKSTQECPVCRI